MGTAVAAKLEDFTQISHSAMKYWTGGMIRHLCAAITDSRVTVIFQDGFCLTNVTIKCLQSDKFIVVSYFDNGTSHETYYNLFDLDMILVDGSHLSVALTSYRKEIETAVAIAKEKHGQGREGGMWTAYPGVVGVSVSYYPQGISRPSQYNGTGTAWIGTIYL